MAFLSRLIGRAFSTTPRSITLPSTGTSTPPPTWSSSSSSSSSPSSPTTPRILSYYESGAPNGSPVLYVHGTPDSGISIANPTDHATAQRLKVRWIGIDRPGIGDSTPQPGHTATGWADGDVRALLDRLGIGRARVLSVSGGTAHGLACARSLGDRLDGVAVVAGVAPMAAAGLAGMGAWNRLGLRMWRFAPWLMRMAHKRIMAPAAQSDDPALLEEIFRRQLETLEGRDRAFLDQPHVFDSVVRSLRSVYKQGVDGLAEDMRIVTSDWGFRLEDVGYEGVRLWYAHDDVNTPPSMGLYMQKRLAGARLRVVPGTHFTLWGGVGGILEDLLADQGL